MFATKEVDLGGGLNAIVRRPDFANWVEYEDLVNGRYEEDTEPAALRDIKQKHAREDQVVQAVHERAPQRTGRHVLVQQRAARRDSSRRRSQ